MVSSKIDSKTHPPLYRFKFKCPLDDEATANMAESGTPQKTGSNPSLNPKAVKKQAPRATNTKETGEASHG